MNWTRFTITDRVILLLLFFSSSTKFYARSSSVTFLLFLKNIKTELYAKASSTQTEFCDFVDIFFNYQPSSTQNRVLWFFVII